MRFIRHCSATELRSANQAANVLANLTPGAMAPKTITSVRSFVVVVDNLWVAAARPAGHTVDRANFDRYKRVWIVFGFCIGAQKKKTQKSLLRINGNLKQPVLLPSNPHSISCSQLYRSTTKKSQIARLEDVPLTRTPNPTHNTQVPPSPLHYFFLAARNPNRSPF